MTEEERKVAEETESETGEENLEDNMTNGDDEFDELIDAVKNGDIDLTNRRLLDLRENHNKLRQRVFDLEKTVMDRDKEIKRLHEENLDKLLNDDDLSIHEEPDGDENNVEDDEDYLGNLTEDFRK